MPQALLCVARSHTARGYTAHADMDMQSLSEVARGGALVVMPDLPGHGRSDGMLAYTPERYVGARLRRPGIRNGVGTGWPTPLHARDEGVVGEATIAKDTTVTPEFR